MPLAKPVPKTAEDYWSLPEGERAELVDGELWSLASPSRKHQEIVHQLAYRLQAHIDGQNGSCKVYPAPFAVNLFGDDSTFVEPDVSLVCDRSKLSDRGCEGAPDLIVEVVSPGHPGIDYISKLALYQRAGVREYWICDPDRARTHVYRFEGDQVPSIYPFAQAVPCGVLPGFAFDFAAAVEGM